MSRLSLLLILPIVLLLAVEAALGQAPVTVTNLGYDPCSDPDKVTVQVVNEGSGSGNTELVPVFGSTRIWLCSARLQGGAVGTMYAQFGDGAACTTNADYLSVHTFTAANAPAFILEAAGGNATFKRSQPARAFCIYRSTAMTAVGHIRFVQE